MEETLQERRSALDEFAARTGGGAIAAPAMQQMFAPPAEAIYGARDVAVRRDERQILLTLKELAAAAGTDWFYRFPVKNKKTGRTEYIEGPSIKLANELARRFGNNNVDCRVQDLGDVWMIYARFHDLETGYSLTRPFQQRKSGSKLGGDDDARRLDIALQIGASKAIRNVIVNALQVLADYAFEEAKNSLIEKIGRDLDGYRTKTIDRVAELVELNRVEAVIGRAAPDWLAPDIAKIIAMYRAIKDGMASVEETFPPLRTAPGTAETIDAFVETPSPAAPAADAGQAAAVEQSPHPAPVAADTAAASITPDPVTEAAADPKGLERDMVEQLLTLAADKSRPLEERLEQLDIAMIDWHERLPERGEFVSQAIKTAADVASGRGKLDAARRYLETLAAKP